MIDVGRLVERVKIQAAAEACLIRQEKPKELHAVRKAFVRMREKCYS